jgi:hypothetical protein
MEPVHLHQRPAVLYLAALMLFGGQLLSIGILGELIVAHRQRDVQPYSIAERTGAADSSNPPTRDPPSPPS